MKKLLSLVIISIVLTACGPNSPPDVQADRISGTISNWPNGQTGTLQATDPYTEPVFGQSTISANGSFSLTLRTPTEKELQNRFVYLCQDTPIPGYTLQTLSVQNGVQDMGIVVSTNYTPTQPPTEVGQKSAARVYLTEAFTVTTACAPRITNNVTIPAGWSILVGEVVSTTAARYVRLSVNSNLNGLEWYFIANP